MSYPVVRVEKGQKVVEGHVVTITNTFHSKNPQGLRTIRTEYLDNMPHSAGGWLAGTVTERVVDGRPEKLKTVIPEHRVA